MILKAYDNGFGISLGDEFIHDGRKRKRNYCARNKNV